MLSTLRFIRHFVCIVLVLGFAQIGIALVPCPVVAHTDIRFGDHARQSMDIYFPRNPRRMNEPVGAFLFIHGGSWVAGNKEEYRMFAIPMAREGFVSATTNYRLRPDATVAEMLEDIGLAIATLRETAERHGVEISSVALFGDSAGGHLALLYSYLQADDPSYEPALPISFVVARVPPTDVNLDDSVENSVLNAISANAPPTIVAFATHDELIDMDRHAYPLREQLEYYDVTFEWFIFDHSGHNLLHVRDIPSHNRTYGAVFAFACRYF